MSITTCPVGALDTNCYLVPGAADTLYIIDPGAAGAEIAALAQDTYDFQRAVVLLTHGHVDHISGLAALMRALPVAAVYLNAKDHALYRSPDNCLLPVCPAASGLPEVVDTWSAPDMQIIPTPGHTPGGVCFYFPGLPALFSGDTLFAGAVGRTDFPGGDTGQLLHSIRTRLMTLPDDLPVYPGHGAATTIGREKRTNPFF